MTEALDLDSLLDNLPVGPGRRGGSPLLMDLEREVEKSDLVALATAPERETNIAPLARLRSSHHQVARLLAEGVRQEEISLITGYAAPTISNLKNDPAFKELMSYYEVQKAETFTDMLARLQLVGLDMLEELHERLINTPDKLTNREIIEAVQLTLDRSGFGPSSTINTTTDSLAVSELIAAVKKEMGNRQTGNIRTIDAQSYTRVEMDGASAGEAVVHSDRTLVRIESQGEDV